MFDSVLPSLRSLLRGLSPFHSSSPLSSRVSKKDLEEICRIIYDLEDLEKKWKGLEDVLNDAEKRQMHEESVQFWLSQLRDLADEVLDLCDAYEYKVVAREMESSSEHSSSSTDAAASEIERPEELDDEGRSSTMSYVSPLLDANFRVTTSDGLRRIRKKISTIENLRNRETKGGDFGMDSSIGASIGSLLQRLNSNSSSSASSSLRQDEQAEISRIVQDLEGVRRNWEGILALLADAEERQICEESVRQWLNEVRKLAYEMVDLRDVYEYEVVAREVQASKKAPSSSGDASTSKRRKVEEPYVQVRSSMVTSLSPLLDASFRDQITRDVERMKKEFDAIFKQMKALHLKEADGRNYSSNDGVYKREPTGHLPTDPVFLGRDRELEQLREMSLADHGDSQMNVEVIAVIGMGGAGKTTLAQHVYQDPQDKAVELIKDKKVLLVTDDVWNTESWESFVAPFNLKAKKGSKILVTTRFPKVANGVRAVKSFKLGFLSEEDGWYVLKKHAFPNESNEVDNLKELEGIGKRIVRKCGGLPLSIKLLGCLLCSKGNDEDGWREVLRSNLLDVEHGVQENEQILGSLYLSYLYLSPKLKACFKFCATYPNDGISPRRLKCLWMAHDLANDEREATECLYELESRSFLDLYRDDFDGDDDEEIRMHDHIYDLAQFVLGEKHQELDYYVFPEEPSEEEFLSSGHASHTNPMQLNEDFFSGSRHASLTFRNIRRQTYGRYQDTRRVYIDMNVSKLCTLKLVEGMESDWYSSRVVNVRMSSGQCIRDLYICIDALCVTSQSHFKCLRVLVMRTTLCSIPHWVSQLYNLRYLELWDLQNESMSDTVFDLRNLRWLILEGSEITYLSEAISSLTNLRELHIKDSEVTYLPEAISRLTNLRELNAKGSKITYLPEAISGLTNLRELNLKGSQITYLPEAISGLTNLRELNVKGSKITYLPEAISRLTNLRELNVEGSKITYLPKTISELVNLQELNLNRCRNFRELPEGITNLTNLRVLKLKHTPISFMPKGFGALTKLEYLTNYAISSTEAGIAELKNMKHLKEVIQIKNLCKVASEEDAAQAEMANRNHLRVLFLCWSEVMYRAWTLDFLGDDFEYYYDYLNTSIQKSDGWTDETDVQFERGKQARDAHQKEGIFEQLRPHPTIEQLFIADYGGFKLPIWMGDQSFTKLVRLHLYEVDYCTSLSPMDQLPSLEALVLECMDNLVELIPDQNVGCVGIMHPVTEQEQSFPKLKKLIIIYCKSLESLPLHRLTSLEELKLECMDSLVELVPDQSVGCAGIVHPATEQGQSTTNLRLLYITNCNSLEYLPLHRLTSLECLELKRMDSLVELVPDQSVGRAGVMHPATEQGQSFRKLRTLNIADCKSLEYLPLHRLSSLEFVTVYECSNLKRVSYNITCPITSVYIDRFPCFASIIEDEIMPQHQPGDDRCPRVEITFKDEYSYNVRYSKDEDYEIEDGVVNSNFIDED